MAMRLARALLHEQIYCSAGASGTRSALPILRRSFASASAEQLTAEALKPDSTVAGSVGAVSEESAVALKPGEVGKVAGVPEQHLHRKVVIYSPSRVASQQGRSHLGKWKINFESTNKWENPLMGWTSTGDPYSSVGEAGLSFDSKEAAVEFARKYGWEYTVKEPHHATLKPKAYSDNFKWKGAPVMGDEQ